MWAKVLVLFLPLVVNVITDDSPLEDPQSSSYRRDYKSWYHRIAHPSHELSKPMPVPEVIRDLNDYIVQATEQPTEIPATVKVPLTYQRPLPSRPIPSPATVTSYPLEYATEQPIEKEPEPITTTEAAATLRPFRNPFIRPSWPSRPIPRPAPTSTEPTIIVTEQPSIQPIATETPDEPEQPDIEPLVTESPTTPEPTPKPKSEIYETFPTRRPGGNPPYIRPSWPTRPVLRPSPINPEYVTENPPLPERRPEPVTTARVPFARPTLPPRPLYRPTPRYPSTIKPSTIYVVPNPHTVRPSLLPRPRPDPRPLPSYDGKDLPEISPQPFVTNPPTIRPPATLPPQRPIPTPPEISTEKEIYTEEPPPSTPVIETEIDVNTHPLPPARPIPNPIPIPITEKPIIIPSVPTIRPQLPERPPLVRPEPPRPVVPATTEVAVPRPTVNPLPSPPVTRPPYVTYPPFEKDPPIYIPNREIYEGEILSGYSCKQHNSYYEYSNECDSYVECKNEIAYKFVCPDGLYYNPNAIWPEYPCSYPSEVSCEGRVSKQSARPTAACPRQYGYFPVEDSDCSRYVMCQEGLATVMNCPAGLVFNSATSSCDWPVNVPQCNPAVFQGFTCPAPPLDEYGQPSDIILKYRYGKSCREYVACQRGHPRLLRCDLGLYFDEKYGICVDGNYDGECVN